MFSGEHSEALPIDLEQAAQFIKLLVACTF
jgi:hypothetical protein